MTSLRSKRLTKPLDPAVQAFLDSSTEDADLVHEDVLGSLAHTHVLERAGLLSPVEASQLRTALRSIANQADFVMDPGLEDVHMNIEASLSATLGELGRKLHTARSRNDQVALDLRLWARRQLLATHAAIQELANALLEHAVEHSGLVAPGHTHWQPAQPVLLSHHLNAHACKFVRDLDRLQDAWPRVNTSPLGAGALAGTRHGIDPSVSASLLGFDGPFRNSLDAVSDRDFLHDLVYAQTLALHHASQWAEEIILWNHPSLGFVALDDAHSTGSSIMPQKRNPDVLEVTRARAASHLGALTAMLSHIRSLPLAYNRDLQETKRVALDAVPRAVATLRVLAALTRNLTFNAKALQRAAEAGHPDATEVADYLAERGVPFRDAHEQAALVVQRAAQDGLPLSNLPLEALQAISPLFQRDVFERLGARATVAAKTSPGGTAPGPTQAAIAATTQALGDHARFWAETVARTDAAEHALLGAKEDSNP